MRHLEKNEVTIKIMIPMKLLNANGNQDSYDSSVNLYPENGLESHAVIPIDSSIRRTLPIYCQNCKGTTSAQERCLQR